MLRRLAVSLAALALIAGCQGSGEDASRAPEPAAATTAAPEPATTTAPQPATTAQEPATTEQAEGTTDQAAMERVVREWSEHLNAEENLALARLFALPAVVAQVGGLFELTTYEEIAAWFAGLPCSGSVVSITVAGPDVAIAVFELGDRPSSSCDGPGELAAAEFHFRDGKLIAWAQVAVPGEQGPATEPVETAPVA